MSFEHNILGQIRLERMGTGPSEQEMWGKATLGDFF